MLTNDIQYRDTKAWLERFEASALELASSAGPKRTRLQQLQIDAANAQADDLRAELADVLEITVTETITLTNNDAA